MLRNLIIFILTALLLSFSYKVAAAKPETPLPKLPDLPTQSGLYSDPENSALRVRVYVHKDKLRTETQSSLICNLEDPNSTALVSTEAWHLPSNVTYSLNTGSVPSSVGSSNLPAIVNSGFSDWASASGSKVSFTRGSDTSNDRTSLDYKNIIAWGRTSSGTLGVTYIRYYTATGLVADVDTIMNKRVPWSWTNSSSCADPNSYDARDIMEHEQGHWMGLDDEYNEASFKDATMFGYGKKGEVKKTTLTTGDTSAAYSIYNP